MNSSTEKASVRAKTLEEEVASGIPIECVLGGGGIKGFNHIGFLRAVEELGIRIGTVDGVSIGSLVGTFYKNGYNLDEIEEIFLSEIHRLHPGRIIRSLLPINPLAALFSNESVWGVVGLKTIVGELIDKYELTPRDDLRIIAYNILRRRPVVFEGTDYNLVDALTASCAVPLVMRPIWYGQAGLVNKLIDVLTRHEHHGLLVDGGLHHPCPADFVENKAIIAKLGFATRLPSDLRSYGIVDLYFHLLECFSSSLLSWMFPDPEGHIVLNVGSPDVAGLSFGISHEKCQEMISHGFDATLTQLGSDHHGR